jgi:hypothetical protein
VSQLVYLQAPSEHVILAQVEATLANNRVPYVICDPYELSSERQFFQHILGSLSLEVDGAPKRKRAKGDPLLEFVSAVEKASGDLPVLVIPSPMHLDSLGPNFILRLLDLPIRLSLLLVSEIPFHLTPHQYDFPSPILVTADIFDKPHLRKRLVECRESDVGHLRGAFAERNLLSHFESMYASFVHSYVDILGYACRDALELRQHVSRLFPLFAAPALSMQCEPTDVAAMMRAVQLPLRDTAHVLFSRFSEVSLPHQNSSSSSSSLAVTSSSSSTTTTTITTSSTLPVRTKYLLVAGFLASRIATRFDMKYFAPMAVRQRKRRRTKNADHERTMLEKAMEAQPKPFEMERLLALFYALYTPQMNEGFVPDSLLRDVATLCSLRLFSREGGAAGSSSNSNALAAGVGMLENPRLKALMDVDTAKQVARSIGIDILEYLNR